MKLQFFVFLTLFTLSLHAQTSDKDSLDNSDTTGRAASTSTADTKMKKNTTKNGEKADNKSTEKSEKTENTAITLPTDSFTNWTRLISVIGLLAVMICGLIYIFGYVKEREVFIGHNTIKLVGFILLLPAICILSLVIPNTIGGPVLATLFGTIAGYVLSRQANDSDRPKDSASNFVNRRGDTNENVDTLKKQVEDLKKENEALKAKQT